MKKSNARARGILTRLLFEKTQIFNVIDLVDNLSSRKKCFFSDTVNFWYFIKVIKAEIKHEKAFGSNESAG